MSLLADQDQNFLDQARRPGVLRILAAVFYDAWLIIALWLLGTTIDTLLRHALYGDTSGNHLLLQGWFLLAPLFFFGWFWTHGGQTIGMRAWRLRVVDAQGQPINKAAAVKRYFAALASWLLLGLGFFWLWFDRDQNTLHDRLSGTYLVVTQKRRRKSKPTPSADAPQ